MAVEYRTLRPDEEDAALDLWTEVLAESREERRSIFYDFADDPRRFARTFVAVAPDGTLLAVASYWLRHVRDANGLPRRVGHVWGVATRADARRQSHAGRLLEQVIAAMRQEGCAWSVLYTQEPARLLYERYGWRTFPTPYRDAVPSNDRPPMPTTYTVLRYDPTHDPDGWTALAAMYADYNATRPMTVVRDNAYWRSYITRRLVDWTPPPIVFVAAQTAEARAQYGYVVMHCYEQLFFVSEMGVRPGGEAAIQGLLGAVVDEAVRCGSAQRGQICLPHEPHIDTALETMFGQTVQEGNDYTLMARTIEPGFSENQLTAMFDAPGAIAWIIDQF